MHALIAAQVAFCFLVLFVAGLFAASFERLSHRPLGFAVDRLLILSAVSSRPQTPVFWRQVADHLQTVPGVESVAISGWPLLTPNGWNGFITVNGAATGPVLAYFLAVSPGWLGTMGIPLLDGADFQARDTSPGAAIVNETFVREFLNGRDAVGKRFGKGDIPYRVVGVVRDSPYRDIRESIVPVAYVPFQAVDDKGAPEAKRNGTFIVRTSLADPLALDAVMRREVAAARPGFRVSSVTTQAELLRAQTMRERLVAMLALFFAAVAVLLAGVGLYGVLDYSVLQQRREISIRMAIGAQAGDIVRRVTGDILAMVAAGGIAGVALGLTAARYVAVLLYDVTPTELGILLLPVAAIAGVAAVAGIPPVLRAVRVDAAAVLRGE